MRDAVDATLAARRGGDAPADGDALVLDRRRRFALVASLLLHVLALAVASRFVWADRERVERARDPIVTIEHRAHRRPPSPVAVRPRPRPRPAVAARTPAVVAVRPHAARAAAAAAPRPAAAAAAAPARVARAPHTVAHRPAVAYVPHVPSAVPPAQGRGARLSPAQLARLDRSFAQTIAQARAGAPDPLAGVRSGGAGSAEDGAATGGDIKSYGPALQSSTAGELHHSGLCDPIKDWQQDGFDYYYVICNVKFSDGTYRREGVPWPVRFPPGNDPFTGTAHAERPLSMPLPGWTLGPGETISKELREYAHEHGVEIAAP